MLKFFSRKKTLQQTNPQRDETGDTIPRYPPFAKGLPTAHTSRILQDQRELITSIQGTLRFISTDFERVVLPVIECYADYVHLLPASESHHHRGAGGLLRHGLEVGFWAARKAESYHFCVGETPMKRREDEPRWQYAAFLGGLLHDVGKPLSDVAVTNQSGDKEWNPYDSSLQAWFQRDLMACYYVRWRDKRNKRHEKFSLMNLDQIIVPAAKSYLNKPGPHIMEALLEAIAGTGAAEPLTKIVMWADQESVRRDLINERLNVDECVLGVPVERFVFDALRRLVEVSKINVPGAQIWCLQQGVFLVWKQIVKDIYHLIDQDQIPGIPRNPESLADILIERGFAIPYQEDSEAKPARYWCICPDILNGVPLQCLRLDNPELIFTHEPPVIASAGQRRPSEIRETQDERQDRSAQSPLTQPTPKAPVNDHHYLSRNSEKPPLADDTVLASQGPRSRHPVIPKTQNVSQKKESPSKIQKMVELAASVESQAALNIAPTNKLPIKGFLSASSTQPKSAREPIQQSRSPEQNYGDNSLSPGRALIREAIKQTLQGHILLERLPDSNYGIPYPVSAQTLGEPRQVMADLSHDNMLQIDQLSTSKITPVLGKKYLVLSRVISQAIHEKLHADPSISRSFLSTVEPTTKIAKTQTRKTSTNLNRSGETQSNSKAISGSRKLPSQELFDAAFIEQIVQGFGPYLAGDIQIQSTAGGDSVYQIPIDSIQTMADHLNTTPTTIRTMVRKTPCVTIRLDHSQGDYIEFVQKIVQ